MTARTPGERPQSSHIVPWDQRLAGALVRPLRFSRVHPNHFTCLTLALGIASACLFATGYAGIAALAYMFAVFTDHLDGELARISGKITRLGHDYDYIVGGINYTMLFSALGIGLYPEHGAWVLWLGLGAGLCNPVILWLRMTMEERFGLEAVEHPRYAGIAIEDFIYLIGPITWLFGPLYFLVPFGLGTFPYLGWTAWEFRRRAAGRTPD